MLPENAAALVGAGMLSVLLLPMLGLNRLRRSGGVDPDASHDSHSAFGRGEEPL
jgi:hypothetical protein